MSADNLGTMDYAGRPCYAELAAVTLVGLLHVTTEVAFSELAARLYNVVAALAILGYLAWRLKHTAGVLRVWGMRRDSFLPALLAQLSLTAVGAIVLVGYGVVAGSLNLPSTFWVTIALYPIWGFAQQFALQNMIAKNLAGLFSNRFALAVAASAMFGAAHFPRLELVLLTFLAGLFLTSIYRRFQNLWAVGLAHGILGSLAVYIVLEEDPGRAILDFLFNT